ncbi:phosphoglucosamine mutase [Rubrobacter calidifluminis]|uniref:phosphoglucosamine mutase n=1 Tax=Rubrobacter calidifluminis TaxID=1392640 RepID=UPI002360E1E2|nr:phosphoglucosamine mutase [Rubrobacter calidifluminis]
MAGSRIRFGTDGVRGEANSTLRPEHALRLGLAAARTLGRRVCIGRDTRLSGGMLSCALAAGLASGGTEVLDLGVLPTPAVAALAPELGMDAAGVVSASHNPYPDNGIKFFSGEGVKLSGEQERELERLAAGEFPERPVGSGVGGVRAVEDAAGMYVEGVLSRLYPDAGGRRILLDCANGAACETAPLAFERLGAHFGLVAAEPDGTNINDGCGSTHIGDLDPSGYDVAFAFDGDADRVLALDERGGVVDGDRIIAILARDLAERGQIGGGIVVTVMSNLGFFKAMERLGIPCEVVPVGDRYVAEAMRRTGAAVGGEQSGHVIVSRYTKTGDGLVTALALLEVMERSGMPLYELAGVMEVYPQTLINVPVGGADAGEVCGSEEVRRAVEEARRRLGDEGRILLRPSGTEPVVRVMVEHLDERVCTEVCEEVAEVVAGVRC